MRMPNLRHLTEMQWHQLPLQTRVVVVHPLVRHRWYVVSEAIARGALYFRLTAAASASDLTARFQAESAGIPDNLQAHDVLLDECDCASMDALLAFVRYVVVNHARWRVIMVSRCTPQRLFSDPTLRPVMRYIPCIDDVPRWDHLNRVAEHPWIEVSALGRGLVSVDGNVITEWGGDLPRNLFFFLIERSLVRRSEIFAVFWPTLSFSDATNVFHVTKHKVAKILGLSTQPALRSLTRWDGEFYHLTSELQIDYDVTAFRLLCAESQIAEPAEAIDLLENAVSLYRNHFLTQIDAEWASERRAELRGMYADALVQLAACYQAIGASDRAYGAYLRACAHDHTRQETVKQIMLLARDRGTPQDGVRLYERLVAVNGGKDAISPDLTALYEAMR